MVPDHLQVHLILDNYVICSIATYLEAHNDDLKPYLWTATAEDILAKLQRVQTTLDALAGQN